MFCGDSLQNRREGRVPLTVFTHRLIWTGPMRKYIFYHISPYKCGSARLLGRLHTLALHAQFLRPVGMAVPPDCCPPFQWEKQNSRFTKKPLYFVRQLGTCQQKQVKAHELLPGGLMPFPSTRNFPRFLD